MKFYRAVAKFKERAKKKKWCNNPNLIHDIPCTINI